MTTGTQLAVVPANFQLPAHLQTAEAAAAIAAYNAAAAGGIKLGGFPRISIKGSKFHIVEGGETTTIMAPAAPGQPQLPMMILEAVILSANPQLSKTYYEGDYQPGDDKEPTCSADNGIVPDAHIAAPQHSNCAACPKNQWGSKQSKISGKDIKACSDTKRLAIVPAANLAYKALGLSVTPSSLGDWGKYVKALSERNIPVNAIVTNITFDATASHPKLLFSFNRVLSAEEYAKVVERAKGDDVKNIVSPVRQITVPVPQLPRPVAAPVAPATPAAPPPPPPAAPAPVAPPTGFGAPTAPVAPSPAAPVPPVDKPKRAPRKTAVDESLAHLPPHILATVQALGVTDPTAQALLAKYPKPAAPEQVPAAQPAPDAKVGAPIAAAPTGFGGGALASTPAPAVTTAPGLTLKDQLAARLRAAPPAPPAAQ